MISLLLAIFVVLGCYLAARHLVLAPQNRALVARPMKHVKLIGGRVSDFHATQVEPSGIGAVAVDEINGVLRHRSTLGQETLLDVALITAVTRKIRYRNDGMTLIVHYRVRPDTVPEEIVIPFESRQIRDYWAMLLGADAAGNQRIRPHPLLPAVA
jgi:hypothetical protein